MKLRAKYIINQICYILIMSAGLCLTAFESKAAVAPGDENTRDRRGSHESCKHVC